MRKSKVFILIAVLALVALSGCSLKMTKYEQTIDGSKMDFSKIDKMKKGTACLGGGKSDNSLATAAKNGDIKVVHHVEKESSIAFLGALGKNCTIAYGK